MTDTTQTTSVVGSGQAGLDVLTMEEKKDFARAASEMKECGETETEYAVLLRWAQLGLLECTHFNLTLKGQDILDEVEDERND